MPIYEYKCKKCGENFEALVRGHEKPACPKCGSKNLDKQISAFAAKTDENYKGSPSCSCSGESCSCSGDSCSSPSSGHHHHSGCCCGGCCH